jgi:coenzyme F420-reducing hydrogenase beta subunit
MTIIHQETEEEKQKRNNEFIKKLGLFCKEQLEENRNKGVISKSMNVDTKSSHKLEYKGYWILVEGKMPIFDLNKLKEKINEEERYVDAEELKVKLDLKL